MAEADRLPAISGSLRQAARRFGTPLFATDTTTLGTAAAAVRDAFPDPWLHQYSLKANDVPAIVARIATLGFGANVVSAGEWRLAAAAGIPNSRITFEGIGKTDAELRAAVRAAWRREPLGWLALESADEANALARHAARLPEGITVDVLVRLNPDVSPETNRGLAVGRGGSKFGMTETELSELVQWLAVQPGIRPRGVHLHVGSQLGAVDAWRDGVRRALALVALIGGSTPDFDTLDVGGGLPLTPLGESGPDPARFAKAMPDLLEPIPPDRRPARLAIEPGRYLVGRAGWLVARVLHVRDRSIPLVVLDTGMTELLRPALYGAIHPIVALTSLGRPFDPSPHASLEAAEVHGPICESTDELGEHQLPPLRRGDVVAFRDAGAYAASMSSAYNGRPRPPQVLIEPDGSLVLARRRGVVA